MRHPSRFFGFALASLTLLAIPVLNADVTLRYKMEVKMNPTLPPQLVEQATKGMSAAMPHESSLQFKNGKGFSSSGANASICDFTKQEITLLDKDGKRYATVPAAKLGDEMTAAMPQMPEQAKAAMAAMKTHFQSKVTGQTATIMGVEAEEREMEITVDAPPMPNVPAGPMMRMVMHLWMPKTGETMRVPGIRELAGYNLYAFATMNPAASMQKMFQQMPGFADAFQGMMKEMQSGGAPVVLRIQFEMYMPMVAAMVKQNPAAAAAFGGSFDADSAFMTMNQELAELSTGAVPDSVFQIPEGFKAAAAADILKDMMAKAQAAAKQQ